jgi:hypothetical protein
MDTDVRFTTDAYNATLNLIINSIPYNSAVPRPILSATQRGARIKNSFATLCDCGALNANFITRTLAEKLNLQIRKLRSPIGVKTADNKTLHLLNYVSLNIDLTLPTSFKDSSQLPESLTKTRIDDVRVTAIVLDSSPYEFILGQEDMYRLKITRIFPMLFYDLEDNPINNSKVMTKLLKTQYRDKAQKSETDYNKIAMSTERPPSSSAHADQGKPADGGKARVHTSRTGQHHSAAQTVEPLPANRDEQLSASGNSSAARSVSIDTPQSHRVVNNNSTSDSSEKTRSQYIINRPTVGQTIPKDAILQSIDDNDEIDEWDDINAWNNYFESAQQSSEANEQRERVNSEGAETLHTLTLEDIVQKLQIDNYCKNPKLCTMLRE